MYCAAWGESDVPKRTQMLTKTWARQGTYTDPTAQVEGREALIVHIGKFLEQYPGAQIVVFSAVDAHHERFRFGWKMLAADDPPRWKGWTLARWTRRSDPSHHRFLRTVRPVRESIRHEDCAPVG